MLCAIVSLCMQESSHKLQRDTFYYVYMELFLSVWMNLIQFQIMINLFTLNMCSTSILSKISVHQLFSETARIIAIFDLHTNNMLLIWLFTIYLRFCNWIWASWIIHTDSDLQKTISCWISHWALSFGFTFSIMTYTSVENTSPVLAAMFL